MRTVYTDRYNVYPWVMSFAAAVMYWSAYNGFLESNGSRLGAGIGGGTLFLILSVKRLRDIRQAKRNGQDPTILRTKDAQN